MLSSPSSASTSLLLSTLDTAGGSRRGDPGRSIGVRRACDARTGLVDKREREALGATRARRDGKRAPHTLAEATVDACLFAVLTRRVGVEVREFGVEVLGVLAVLESEGLVSRRRSRGRSGVVVIAIVIVAIAIVVVVVYILDLVAIVVRRIGTVVRAGIGGVCSTISTISINSASGAGGSDPCLRVRCGRAGDAGPGLVDQGQREALSPARTGSDCELAADTLGKATIDARLVTIRALRVRIKTGKLGVQILGVFAVLESKRLGICWGGSWGLLGSFGRCRWGGFRCRFRCVLDLVVITIPLDTTSGTSGSDTSFSILWSSAGDAGARLVDKGEGEALSAARASNWRELAVNALSEPAVNARVLARIAVGVGIKSGELGTVVVVLVSNRPDRCRKSLRTSGPGHPCHSEE